MWMLLSSATVTKPLHFLMTKKETKFIETVRNFYATKGRNHLPWRKTTDAYKILVSELMLQQTQVDRVILKYRSFIKHWPNIISLSKARLGEVLKEWQGLGYNRRAKYLHECAKEVAKNYGGQLPKDYQTLQTLPGIGPYTASAVMAFAYDKSVVMIETNIRTVYLHHFFTGKEAVTDKEILRLVERTLPEVNVRSWYAALMDYGTYLKQELGNLNHQSKHYTRQSKFSGSDREIRGAIIRDLSTKDSGISLSNLCKNLERFERSRIEVQIKQLANDGLVVVNKSKISLP